MKIMKKEMKYTCFFIFLIALFLLGPFLSTQSPLDTHPEIACQAPDLNHFLGTDEIGRDVLSRMFYGGRITILIGLGTTLFSCLLGTVLGLLSGYYGGKTDLLISQLIDVSLAFPSLLLAIGLSIILPQSGYSVIIAISLTGWAGFARLIRSHSLVLKHAEYVLASKSLGSSNLKIIFTHILPNSFFLLIVSASLRLGSFMLAESGLSFLGLGVPPPYPTLGGMISSGRDYLLHSPWIPLFPGILIGVIVLACNLFGEELQKVFNPKD